MMRLVATISSIFVLLAVPAFAQSGNPAFMTPDTGPQQPNNADRVFVQAAVIGGMVEVEFGKLAEQKGQSDAVKDFARRMVGDHSDANDRLISLAKEDGIAVPDELDQDHKAMHERLERMSGAEFDRAYVDGQVADHQKTAQLLEHEIGSGQDVEFKSLASEILPVVLGHLEVAQDIQAQMTGKGPVVGVPRQ
jgi:putative membrane protein